MRLTITKRIVITSLIMLTSVLALSGAAIHVLTQSMDDNESHFQLTSRIHSSVELAGNAQIEFKKQVQEWKNILLRGHDEAQFEKYLGKFSKQETLVQQHLTNLKLLLGTESSLTPRVEQLLSTHSELGAKYRAGLKLFDATNPLSNRLVDKHVKGIDRPPTKQMNELLADIRKNSNTQLKALHANDLEHASTVINFYVLGSILAGIIVALASWMLIKSVRDPLNLALSQIQKVASGDLTAQAAVVREDEAGLLIKASNAISSNLGNTLNNITSCAEEVDDTARVIARENTDLAQRTSEQAITLETTSGNIDSISAAMKENAELAVGANSFVTTVRSQAHDSAEVAQQVGKAMADIQETSSQIAAINDVVNEIAFQTNLLALNASVEAARAGDQGRGFAVVASEVRALAQRSASAAKEIKGLIDDSEDKVATGTRLAKDSGKRLKKIVQSIDQASGQIHEITMKAEEQAGNVAAINLSLTDMDQATQQNTVLVEQMSQQSDVMRERSIQLRELINFFTLPDRGFSSASHSFSKERKQEQFDAPPSGAERRKATRPWSTAPVAHSPDLRNTG